MNHLSSKRYDRAIRLEILRARAAIERESFADQVDQLSLQTSPAYLLGSLLDSRRLGWLKKSGDLLAQYPFIIAALSSLLMGRSSRLARGAGLLLTVLQGMLSQQAKDKSLEI